MDYYDLFRRHDDSTRREFPLGFDCEAAAAKFDRFCSDLATVLGAALQAESGSSIRDASFHSQIYLPLPNGSFSLLRFSNFGDMAAIMNDEQVPDPLLETVTMVLFRHGYFFIPTAELNTPYFGRNPDFNGASTWWRRYFDCA